MFSLLLFYIRNYTKCPFCSIARHNPKRLGAQRTRRRGERAISFGVRWQGCDTKSQAAERKRKQNAWQTQDRGRKPRGASRTESSAARTAEPPKTAKRGAGRA
jgi:hypothetical protein